MRLGIRLAVHASAARPASRSVPTNAVARIAASTAIDVHDSSESS
jgi:hypothetical protein